MPDGQNGAADLSQVAELAKWMDQLQSLLREVASAIDQQQCPIPEQELDSLRSLFFRIVVSLVTMMTGATIGAVLLIGGAQDVLQLRAISAALAAGFSGSAMAALRSALDRRAHGFESKDGKQWPDPLQKKERFSKAMSYWFIVRPFLGIPMGALAYWAIAENILRGAAREEASPISIVLWAFVAGLFAKTIIEFLLKAVKQVLRVEG